MKLDADQPFDLLRFLADIDAVQDHPAGIDGAEGLDHLQGGRFPRPVGTEDAENLLSLHVKADLVNGMEIVVAFGKIADF